MATNGKGRVAVIGGGVSGLSAAHELAEQGFSVTVFERRKQVGGKAASWQAGDLPAEHGFRFFPGFYFHVIHTMSRIPAADGRGCVAAHLVDLDKAIMADGHGHRLTNPLPTRNPRPLLRERVRAARSFRPAMPRPWESACFLAVVARLATGCEQRWEQRLEHQNWIDHVMNPKRIRPRSKKFVRLFAVGLTRSFVATRAEEMNARTGGKILLQLLYDTYFGPPVRRAPDRALDGPTSKVWIEPWRKCLEGLGVAFRTGCTVASLEIPNDRVEGIRLQSDDLGPDALEMEPGQLVGDKFDWYILAVPCEVLKQLLVSTPRLLQLDPNLRGVFNLRTRWMNGIVLGLADDLDPPLPRGHVLCLRSPWALTLVDQSKIWSEEHLAAVRKHWKALLSIDISDWVSPGTTGLPARSTPTTEQLVADLWAQLQSHLPELKDREVPRDFALDHDIQYGKKPPLSERRVRIVRKQTNDEPLLINTAGSWRSRPEAATKVPNLFIAGDFTQTFTEFASMEAANEAARRAVNQLLVAAGHHYECAVQPLEDPNVWWFAYPQRLARKVDRAIFRSRLPFRPPFRLPIAAWTVLGILARITGTSRRAARPISR